MARTRREAHEAPHRAAGREPAGSSAGGPLDVVVEEERLPDGRYVLYYTWTHPVAADGSVAGAADDAGDTDGPGDADDPGAPGAGPVDDR